MGERPVAFCRKYLRGRLIYINVTLCRNTGGSSCRSGARPALIKKNTARFGQKKPHPLTACQRMGSFFWQSNRLFLCYAAPKSGGGSVSNDGAMHHPGIPKQKTPRFQTTDDSSASAQHFFLLFAHGQRAQLVDAHAERIGDILLRDRYGIEMNLFDIRVVVHGF